MPSSVPDVRLISVRFEQVLVITDGVCSVGLGASFGRSRCRSSVMVPGFDKRRSNSVVGTSVRLLPVLTDRLPGTSASRWRVALRNSWGEALSSRGVCTLRLFGILRGGT